MTKYPSLRKLILCFLSFLTPKLWHVLLRENLTRFHTRSVPSISVLDYLKRIVRFTNVEVCVYVYLHLP